MNSYSSTGKMFIYLYNHFMHSRCPFQGVTLYNDSVDTTIVISNLQSVTSHCAVLIIDMYVTLSSSDTNSDSSNSG